MASEDGEILFLSFPAGPRKQAAPALIFPLSLS